MKHLVSILFLFLSTTFFLNNADAEDGSTHSAASHSDSASSLPTLDDDPTALFKYVCPMHPQIVRDHEGSCPICGMDLVKQAFEQTQSAPKISAGASSDDGVKQGFAIRTNEVKETTLWKYIPTFGKVVADETKVVHIHPRASGWISDLSVRSNGESVKKGSLLYRLYSPEIVSAQQDLLLARQNQKRMGKAANSLLASAKIRLKLLGVRNDVIKIILRKNKTINEIPIYAPQDGIATNLVVQDGMFVQPKTRLMSVSDLTSVWVEAEILPLQQAWIKSRLTANITSDAFPEKRWESDIEYIYPVADAKTQALKVRLPVINTGLFLKPNMFMNVEIYGGPKHDVLAIPLGAVIDDGLTKRVVLQLDDGRFEVVKVQTGMESLGVVEIVSGLKKGDKIVTSGQFLIDSESQIQTNLRRLISSDNTSSSK
ncbi:efflux RND transporter periplasmic adaptor subunit [Thiomicrorhabdus sp. Milos-T2]|uniref:efflux RND transporter periplasmic adaptor subunit n=1 Tax=Thiomicrorhabdus sp. Milos-T2 TaxID=90814 RepID=UPI000571BDE8|nr:efflux RND transporter periplasmic adaptor subunit [Thiomicrorhabdus sp. Milos-T2]